MNFKRSLNSQRRGTVLLVVVIATAVLMILTSALLNSRSGAKSSVKRGMTYQLMRADAVAHARAIRHAVDSASSFTASVTNVTVSDSQSISVSSGTGSGYFVTNGTTAATFGTGNIIIPRYWTTSGNPTIASPVGVSDPFYGTKSYQQYLSFQTYLGTPGTNMLQLAEGNSLDQILTYEYRTMPVTTFTIADINPGTTAQTPLYDGTGGSGMGRIYTGGVLLPLGGTITTRYPITAMGSLAGPSGSYTYVNLNLSSYYGTNYPALWKPTNPVFCIASTAPGSPTSPVAMNAADVATLSAKTIQGAVFTSDSSVLPMKVQDTSALAIATNISANWLCQLKIGLNPAISHTFSSLLSGNTNAQQQIQTAMSQPLTNACVYYMPAAGVASNYPTSPGMAYANLLNSNGVASACYIINLPQLLGTGTGVGGLSSLYIDQTGIGTTAVIIINPTASPVNGVTIVSNGPLGILGNWGSYIAGANKNLIIAPSIGIYPSSSMANLDIYSSLCCTAGGMSSIHQQGGSTLASQVTVHGSYSMWGAAGTTNVPVYMAGDSDLESGNIYPNLTPAVTVISQSTNNTH